MFSVRKDAEKLTHLHPQERQTRAEETLPSMATWWPFSCVKSLSLLFLINIRPRCLISEAIYAASREEGSLELRVNWRGLGTFNEACKNLLLHLEICMKYYICYWWYELPVNSGYFGATRVAFLPRHSRSTSASIEASRAWGGCFENVWTHYHCHYMLHVYTLYEITMITTHTEYPA